MIKIEKHTLNYKHVVMITIDDGYLDRPSRDRLKKFAEDNCTIMVVSQHQGNAECHIYEKSARSETSPVMTINGEPVVPAPTTRLPHLVVEPTD